jgi:hypothetical protein
VLFEHLDAGRVAILSQVRGAAGPSTWRLVGGGESRVAVEDAVPDRAETDADEQFAPIDFDIASASSATDSAASTTNVNRFSGR